MIAGFQIQIANDSQGLGFAQAEFNFFRDVIGLLSVKESGIRLGIIVGYADTQQGKNTRTINSCVVQNIAQTVGTAMLSRNGRKYNK